MWSDRQQVQSRRWQRLRDIPVAGAVEVLWAKRRWFCTEEACAHGTVAEATVQVPRRACSEVARAHQVSWWLVQSALSVAAAVLLPDVDTLAVRRLGIDENRYRSVRFYRDQAGAWRRYEPWMSTIVDLATGRVLGVVDGRPLPAWLAARTPAWRDRIEMVVAIDSSAALRKALRERLPRAARAVA